MIIKLISMEKKDNIIAYSGKVIKYRNKEYVIRPEESLRGCLGCTFVPSINCPVELTKYCLQGYIYKKC